MKAKLTCAALLVSALTLAGCFGSINKEYAAAVNDTNNVVLPEYEAYFEADPNLDDEQKERRRRLVASVRERDSAALEE